MHHCSDWDTMSKWDTYLFLVIIIIIIIIIIVLP